MAVRLLFEGDRRPVVRECRPEIFERSVDRREAGVQEQQRAAAALLVVVHRERASLGVTADQRALGERPRFRVHGSALLLLAGFLPGLLRWRHLAAFASRLRETDGDRLLAAGHLLAGASAA